jgi:hypothetical protein
MPWTIICLYTKGKKEKQWQHYAIVLLQEILAAANVDPDYVIKKKKRRFAPRRRYTLAHYVK